MKRVNSLGDRLLGRLVPNTTAQADRYRCYWGYWCINGYVYWAHCCVDDYTGRVEFCDDRVSLGGRC